MHQRAGAGRYLTLCGFETLNGLPFLSGDKAVHDVLNEHSIAEAEKLQVALGKLRRVSGDYAGKLLLIDPHRAPVSPSVTSASAAKNAAASQSRRRRPFSASMATAGSRCVSPRRLPPRP